MKCSHPEKLKGHLIINDKEVGIICQVYPQQGKVTFLGCFEENDFDTFKAELKRSLAREYHVVVNWVDNTSTDMGKVLLCGISRDMEEEVYRTVQFMRKPKSGIPLYCPSPEIVKNN